MGGGHQEFFSEGGPQTKTNENGESVELPLRSFIVCDFAVVELDLDEDEVTDGVG